MRMLIEVSENNIGTVSDSYLITNLRELFQARVAEHDSIKDIVEWDELTKLRNALMKLYREMKAGLVAGGDECIVRIATKKDGPIHYGITFLDDAGKHTGKPWCSHFAFGPQRDDQVSPELYNPLNHV